MTRNIDVWTIIGILISIGAALVIPSISTTYSPIMIAVIAIAILVILIVNEYLKIKNEIEITTKNYEEIRKEINFLEERFKTAKEVAELRARLEMIERTYKK